jgi:hypothetical protein
MFRCDRNRIPGSCSFLNQTTDTYCGNCATVCKKVDPLKPVCVSGTCGCIPSLGCDNSTLYCEPNTEKKCLACPSGKANCLASVLDAGVPNDCEVTLATDANNCGSCGNQCNINGATGHVCSEGKCTCGTTGSICPWDKPFCESGVCVACNDAISDSLCRKETVNDTSAYCNVPSKQCASCPSGFADCTDKNTTGGTDTGTSDTDCETNLVQTGVSNNCKMIKFRFLVRQRRQELTIAPDVLLGGACGAQCGTSNHKAQSCCSGVCKFNSVELLSRQSLTNSFSFRNR